MARLCTCSHRLPFLPGPSTQISPSSFPQTAPWLPTGPTPPGLGPQGRTPPPPLPPTPGVLWGCQARSSAAQRGWKPPNSPSAPGMIQSTRPFQLLVSPVDPRALSRAMGPGARGSPAALSQQEAGPSHAGTEPDNSLPARMIFYFYPNVFC